MPDKPAEVEEVTDTPEGLDTAGHDKAVDETEPPDQTLHENPAEDNTAEHAPINAEVNDTPEDDAERVDGTATDEAVAQSEEVANVEAHSNDVETAGAGGDDTTVVHEAVVPDDEATVGTPNDGPVAEETTDVGTKTETFMAVVDDILQAVSQEVVNDENELSKGHENAEVESVHENAQVVSSGDQPEYEGTVADENAAPGDMLEDGEVAEAVSNNAETKHPEIGTPQPEPEQSSTMHYDGAADDAESFVSREEGDGESATNLLALPRQSLTNGYAYDDDDDDFNYDETPPADDTPLDEQARRRGSVRSPSPTSHDDSSFALADVPMPPLILAAALPDEQHAQPTAKENGTEKKKKTRKVKKMGSPSILKKKQAETSDVTGTVKARDKKPTTTAALLGAGKTAAQVAIVTTVHESKMKKKLRLLRQRLSELKEENKAMRLIQKRQEQAIVKLEGRRSEDAIGALCDRYNEELRVMRGLLRRQRDELKEKERLLRGRDQQFTRASARSKRLETDVKELRGKEGYSNLIKTKLDLQNELKQKQLEIEQLKKQMGDIKQQFEESFKGELLKQKKIRLKLKKLQRIKDEYDRMTEATSTMNTEGGAAQHLSQATIASVVGETLSRQDTDALDDLNWSATSIKLPPINAADSFTSMSTPQTVSPPLRHHRHATPPSLFTTHGLHSCLERLELNDVRDGGSSLLSGDSRSLSQVTTVSDTKQHSGGSRMAVEPRVNRRRLKKTAAVSPALVDPFADFHSQQRRQPPLNNNRKTDNKMTKKNPTSVLDELFTSAKPRQPVVERQKANTSNRHFSRF